VLTAVSSLTTLKSFTINAITAHLNFVTLAHALRTLPTSLQHLEIFGPYLSLAEVATIAAHPGLRTLSFVPDDCVDREQFGQVQFEQVEFGRLVAQWKLHGLHIKDLEEDTVGFDRYVIADWIIDTE